MNDGGPAFPCHEQWNEWSDLKADYIPRTGPRGGMSLRDYFAGQALVGLIASNDEGAGDRIVDIPGYAYAIADAMLKEREKAT